MLLVTIASPNSIRILIPLAFWHCAYSLEFLLNIKFFVDVAAQAKLEIQMSLIFVSITAYKWGDWRRCRLF